MPPRGFLGVEALSGVLRTDIAFQLDGEERIALLKQCNVIDAEIAAHGVDENELAFLAGALLDALLPFGGRQFGKISVNFFGCRGLRQGTWRLPRCSSKERQTPDRQTYHPRSPLAVSCTGLRGHLRCKV